MKKREKEKNTNMGRVYFTADEVQQSQKETEEFEAKTKEIFEEGYLGIFFDLNVILRYAHIKYCIKTVDKRRVALPFNYVDGDAVITVRPDDDVYEISLLESPKSINSLMKTVWLKFIKKISNWYIPYKDLPDSPALFKEGNLGPLLKKYNCPKGFPADYSLDSPNIKYHNYPANTLLGKYNNRPDSLMKFYNTELLEMVEKGFTPRVVKHNNYLFDGQVDVEESLLSQYRNKSIDYDEYSYAIKSKQNYKQIGENLFINSDGNLFEMTHIPVNMTNLGDTFKTIVSGTALETCNLPGFMVLVPMDCNNPENAKKYKALYDII